ncbi:FxLYD domain-containing protein [Candidatus Saccharibacteria bacterium]|nr:FxLYD domain-containing protein [Candidatus Saccharibacteria bacterium]
MADLNKSIDTSKYGGVVLLVILVVGGLAYWNYSNSQNEDTYTPAVTQPISSTLQNTVTESDLKLGDTNEKIDESGYKHIYANVSNNGAAKQGVSVMATLYDSANKVIGTQLGSVQNIASSETKVADIIIFDKTMSDYASFKVTIEGSY